MKHDAYRANILKVLTELAYQIKPSHAKYLFESKISKIEMKDIDLFVLRLVRAISTNMCKGPGEAPKP